MAETKLIMNGGVYFEVESVLGKKIRTTRERWKLISEMKHPIIKSYEPDVKETVSDPDEVRRSKKDRSVYLYYRKLSKYFVCVLVKHLNSEGFVITAYLADKIKKGDIVWKKRQK